MRHAQFHLRVFGTTLMLRVFRPLMSKAWLAVTVAFGLGVISSIRAQTSVTTDPVGFTTTSCQASSDTYVSIPFTRPPVFSGTIASLSTNTVSVNGSPGWTNNQFIYSAGTQPNHYYVLLGSDGAASPREGHVYPITANDSGSLTVDTSSDNLTGVIANTQLTIIPYWTPATIFPASDAGVSFTATTAPPAYQTSILVPNYSAPGINQPFAAQYYFYNNAWRLVGDGADHGDDPLLPDGYLLIRTDNGAPTGALTAFGSVLMKKLAVPLLTSTVQQQDNAIVLVRPVDVPLVYSGLAPIDESFTENDQLFVLTSAAIGASPLGTPYVFHDGWRLSTDLNTDLGNTAIPAGNALLVRKGGTTPRVVGTVFSNNSPTYTGPIPITPLQVASRKQHGASGPFFNVNMPITLGPGIECRTPGGNNTYSVIYTFDRPVSSADGVSLTQGMGGSPTISAGPLANQLTVSLPQINNTGQHLIIALNGIHDAQSNTLAGMSSRMDVLIGDINASKRTDNGDAIQVRNNSGASVTLATFRADVNSSGRIDNGDAIVVRNNSGASLPP